VPHPNIGAPGCTPTSGQKLKEALLCELPPKRPEKPSITNSGV